MSKEQIEQYENETKEAILGEIRKAARGIYELISKIQDDEISEYIAGKIYNIGISANNKIVEISRMFKKHDLSLYCNKKEGEELRESFIGFSIISDLCDRINESVIFLKDYITYKDKVDGPETENAISNFFKNIRYIINPYSDEFVYTDEQIEKMKSYLDKYKEFNNEVYEYEIKDNIVNSIVKYEKKAKSYMKVKNDVAEDMKKLGLEELIPQIDRKINELKNEKREDRKIVRKREGISKNKEKALTEK